MSRLVNIPPLQSVTEVGATTDQATTYTGGLYSDASGTNSWNFGRSNTVTGNNSGTVGYNNNAGSFANVYLFGEGNSNQATNAALFGLNNVFITFSPSTSTSAYVIGESNSGVVAAGAAVVGYSNLLADGAASYANAAKSTTVVGGNNEVGFAAANTVTIGNGNSIIGSGGIVIGLTSTVSHDNAVIIGNSLTSSAANQFTLGGSSALYRFLGTFADSSTLNFSTSKVWDISSDGTDLIIDRNSGSGKVSIDGAYKLPSADGTANQVLITDGAGALSFATPSSLSTAAGGSTTQVQYNNAGALGGMPNFTFDGTNIDFTSGDMRFDDNVDLVFGTGNDAKIYYDGTDLIIDPTLVGSGDLLVGPTANQDLRCNFVGLAGSAISANAVVNCSTSGSARGCLAFSYTKTGGTNIVANINSTVNYQLTTNANAVGVSSTVSEQVSNTGNSNYRCYSAAWNSTVNITTGTHIFKGIELDGGNGPTSASGATVIQVGVHVLPMASFTSATNTRIGGIFEHDLMVTDNTKVVFEGVGGTTYTVGDTYMVYSSSASELQTFVNGNEMFTLTSTAFGIFAVAPQARPAAYTQTYSTATRTHNNVTSSSVATTAATNVAPFGYTTAAQADAIPVAINAVAADLLNLKQLVNQMIDDLQGYGWLQ